MAASTPENCRSTVVASAPFVFDLDSSKQHGDEDGAVLFDFETEAEREAVRKPNPDYGTLITITNCVAASGNFALHVTGMGDTDDAKGGYLPRLLLRPRLTDWRGYDRLVVEVTNARDAGDNGVMRLFIAGPKGEYTSGIWLQLPLSASGYRQWVIPFDKKWGSRLADASRMFFAFERFSDGCDVFIDRIMLLRKGAELPSASPRFLERIAMPMLMRDRDALAVTNAAISSELCHVREYLRFCGELSRSMFCSQDIAVGMATTMEKIRPRDEVAAYAIPDTGIAVRLAGNEYEGVQVAVAARRGDIKGVKVWVADALRGDRGGTFASENITCSPVGYVNVTASAKYSAGYNVKVQESPGYKRCNRKAKKGWWPDPILCFIDSVDLKGADIQSFLVRVHCPKGQPADTYRGTLVVSAAGAESVRIPFKVRVNGFSLGLVSELPLMVDCRPVPHGNWKTAKIPSSPLNMWRIHKMEWGDFLADYLISWDGIYTDGTVEFDILERLLSQNRLGKHFCIGYMGAPRSTNVCDIATWLAKSEGRFTKMRESYNKAKSLGVLDRVYIYGWDERSKEDFPVIQIAVKELNARFPGVPISTTARDGSYGMKSLLSNMDWFIPNTWKYRLARAEESRKAGHQVWWYICDGPRAPYANFFIESQAIEIRMLMGAMAQRMKPDGFLYYRTAMWRSTKCIESGPFTDWLVHTGKENAANGDGYLSYAGPDGIPLPSLRLENFRDGLEDYAYAKLLESKLATRADRDDAWSRKAKELLAVPREVMDTMTNYTDDPAVLYRWRDEMADLIEEAK